MTEALAHPDYPKLQVIGICGSLRNGSLTRKALEIALSGAQEAGADTQLVDLGDYHLIFCDGKQDESGYPEDVFRLRRDVQQAKGIILGTPEYHGSFSGVLKNALDLMGFEEFEGKMLGLVGVSGGQAGALGLLGLRNVGRALHAWVIPEQVSIAEAWKVFDAFGNLKDPDLRKRLKEVGRRVAHFACLHNAEQALDFLKTWEGAPANPGGARLCTPGQDSRAGKSQD
ncbi:MAG TPA: NAD(P)H-dependent oxidoreductase [Terriglobia bacterium]|nr:NAD(P)H-dependent oxidoreductase [Terriglobia bacterium]